MRWTLELTVQYSPAQLSCRPAGEAGPDGEQGARARKGRGAAAVWGQARTGARGRGRLSPCWERSVPRAPQGWGDRTKKTPARPSPLWPEDHGGLVHLRPVPWNKSLHLGVNALRLPVLEFLVGSRLCSVRSHSASPGGLPARWLLCHSLPDLPFSPCFRQVRVGHTRGGARRGGGHAHPRLAAPRCLRRAAAAADKLTPGRARPGSDFRQYLGGACWLWAGGVGPREGAPQLSGPGCSLRRHLGSLALADCLQALGPAILASSFHLSRAWLVFVSSSRGEVPWVPQNSNRIISVISNTS